MEKHRELKDFEFAEKFMNCTLDPEMFTHEAHLRYAFILLNNLGLDRATARIEEDLRKYTRCIGQEHKYCNPSA